jgi:hypothetical protein
MNNEEGVLFTKQDYNALHSLVFSAGYPGYKPTVREIPNGDGKIDQDKRYAHVADKYLRNLSPEPDSTDTLYRYLETAHSLACRVAEVLEVPQEFMPYLPECALRVLEYPAGVGGHAHTDFDLFTLSLYRSEPDRLRLGKESVGSERSLRVWDARKLNPGLHIGELGELIGLGEATNHHVEPSDQVQYSIVYFALPKPGATLADGRTAGKWLSERYLRSRVGT